ncbi:MAG: hypothetical protein M0R46_04610 [Candidatus Muirbacterium halophilum]|nr:hypothetical protein [Candidatus Muirbacterium halophilum]MCK9475177.1 hypothetical protein [Candidatus Muirbacterium halophilum]
MKRLFYFIIIIIFLCINVFCDNTSELFRYFYDSGFITKTASLYEDKIQLNSLEKAAVISEILRRVYNTNGYGVDNTKLYSLKSVMHDYREDILLISDIDFNKVSNKLETLLSGNSGLSKGTSLIEDSTSGINADDLLKRHLKNRNNDYYVVDPEYGEKISKNINEKTIYSYGVNNKKRNSYFFAGLGKFQPSTTSFAYIENDIIHNFGVGYKRSDRIEVELRKMSYKQEKTGDDFFVAGSDYSFEFEPISFILKYKLGKHTRFKPYAGYGISYVKYIHSLIEPGQNEIITAQRSYAPCILYGIEFEEKKDFSMFFEVFAILSEKESFRIKSRIYEIDSNNYTWSFGVKFYFE